MVSRKEVAEKANVSQAVVSYVINNSNYVNAKTRERVEKVIAELGYRPNMIARSLKTSQSHHIAFVCNDFNNPFFPQIAADVTKAAFENGYLLSINDLGYDDTRIELLLQYKVDGMFIASDLFTSEEINAFAQQGIAIVLFSNRKYHNLDPSVACIKIDIYDGMSRLMIYLLGKGHRNFAFISSARFKKREEASGAPENYRYSAFKDRVAEWGGSEESFTIESVVAFDQIADIVNKLLHNRNKVTAIVAGNDAIAFMIIEYLQSRGVRVPQDVAVTGFDAIRYASIFSPKLTTVDLHLDWMSQTAITLLLRIIRKQPYKHVCWDSEVRIGDSA